jgi:nucleoid DNA-binding protein
MGRNVLGKTEFVDFIAVQSGLTKKEAQTALNAVTESVQKALSEGNDINITGFGKFKVAHRAARAGRNPQTGEALQIAASNQVGFSVGAELKRAVN